ncbi:UNVERIFIED_CONTAM: hypothetical protein RMT77_000934 [Armadillidium vulgare]
MEEETSVCFHCDGYYGPSFGQPVCSTCHMFLYPDDSSLHSSSLNCHDLKVEDGDSGNEEPREPSDCNAISDPSSVPETSNDTDHCHLINDESDSHSTEHQNLQPAIQHFQLVESNVNGSDLLISTSNQDIPIPIRSCVKPSGRSSPVPSNKCYDIPHGWEEPLQSQESMLQHVDSTENQKANIHSIPPEVLLVVFQFLDEISLWSVGQVCRCWSQLVNSFAHQWKLFIQRRWPLFNPIYNVTNWHKVFTNLIESAPCQLCLFRMPYNTIPAPHEDSWRRKRLSNERRTLRKDPPEGINAFPLDKMALHWQATIRGPAGSPYQGGTFFLYIQIPSNYPLSPPLVRFITRIFHPNVSRHGDIGIDSIQHNWSVAITISKVLVSIQSLLTDPYTKVCMEPRIGEMYDNNRPQFERIAKAWTWCYAMHDALDPESVVPNYLHRLTSKRVSKVLFGD